MKTIISWCPGQTPPAHCDPCKPKTGCLVPSDATAMGEITCYWVQQGPEVGGPVGCNYRDTNFVTGQVTESVPVHPPTIYAGWTLIVSTTLSWSGGAHGTQQVNLPDVQYTGTVDSTVNAAGVSQAVDQALATMDAAACVQGLPPGNWPPPTGDPFQIFYWAYQDHLINGVPDGSTYVAGYWTTWVGIPSLAVPVDWSGMSPLTGFEWGPVYIVMGISFLHGTGIQIVEGRYTTEEADAITQTFKQYYFP